MNRYQDYVIRDGKFIGKFEEMYRNLMTLGIKVKMEYLIIYQESCFSFHKAISNKNFY